MIKRTLWIARDSIKALSVFDVKPTERWVNIYDASITFPNISYCPIVSGLYGLHKFLAFLNVPIGICWQVETEEIDDKLVITIIDRNVNIKTVPKAYRHEDRS